MKTITDRVTRLAGLFSEDRRWELLLLGSSLLAFLLYAAAAVRETTLAPWRRYQHQYRASLIAMAEDERERRAAESFQIRYYQAYLPGLQRVDRCTTCHAGIDNPRMKDAPQPLTAHPGNILEHHPIDRFGCTICHGGQGRATEAREAHGEEPGRHMPMRRGAMLEVACAICHSDPELPGAPTYSVAQKLFHEKGCLACHTLRGAGGTLAAVPGTQGPELTRQAGQRSFDWHMAYFLDPAKMYPGARMPNLNLTEKEAEALAYLMETFTDEIPGLAYRPRPAAEREPAAELVLTRDQLGMDVDPEAAPGYVGSQTCLACHTSLNPQVHHAWHQSAKARTFAVIADTSDRHLCYECHTTGFNEVTGVFAEASVSCEACHGPGMDYAGEALDGNFSEHKARALAKLFEPDRCATCHRTAHLPGEHHAARLRDPDASPDIPGLPDVPGIPDLPGMPDAPDIPDTPEISAKDGPSAHSAARVCRSGRSPSEMSGKGCVDGRLASTAGLGGQAAIFAQALLLAAQHDAASGDEPDPNEQRHSEMLEVAGAIFNPEAAPGYVGSEICLFCHDDRQLVEHWRGSKKANAYEAVADVPDRHLCLPCHTTGYNPATRAYLERNVGCEACHGPGRENVIDMMEGRRAEHITKSRASNQDRNRCLDCHRVHVPREEHVETIRYEAAVR